MDTSAEQALHSYILGLWPAFSSIDQPCYDPDDYHNPLPDPGPQLDQAVKILQVKRGVYLTGHGYGLPG